MLQTFVLRVILYWPFVLQKIALGIFDSNMLPEVCLLHPLPHLLNQCSENFVLHAKHLYCLWANRLLKCMSRPLHWVQMPVILYNDQKMCTSQQNFSNAHFIISSQVKSQLCILSILLAFLTTNLKRSLRT